MKKNEIHFRKRGVRASWQKASGYTLIEVLVTVAVASIGLLGFASLIGVSSKINNAAYQRAQVGLIAQSLIESMHVNADGISSGSYDTTLRSVRQVDMDCHVRGCTADERAKADLAEFERALSNTLLDPTASIKCSAVEPQAHIHKLYDGVCRVEIDWSERAFVQSERTGAGTLVWIFQP